MKILSERLSVEGFPVKGYNIGLWYGIVLAANGQVKLCGVSSGCQIRIDLGLLNKRGSELWGRLKRRRHISSNTNSWERMANLAVHRCFTTLSVFLGPAA